MITVIPTLFLRRSQVAFKSGPLVFLAPKASSGLPLSNGGTALGRKECNMYMSVTESATTLCGRGGKNNDKGRIEPEEVSSGERATRRPNGYLAPTKGLEGGNPDPSVDRMRSIKASSSGSAVNYQWGDKVQLVTRGKEAMGKPSKTPCIEAVPDEESNQLNGPLGNDDDPLPTSAVLDDLGANARQRRSELHQKALWDLPLPP